MERVFIDLQSLGESRRNLHPPWMNSTTHRHRFMHRDEDGHVEKDERNLGKTRREKNREETKLFAQVSQRERSMFQSRSVCNERAAACAYTCARLSLAIEIWPTSPSTRFADTDVLLPEQKHRPRCTDRHTGCIVGRKRARLRSGDGRLGTMHQFSVHPWYIGRGFGAHQPKYPLRGWRRFWRRQGRISRRGHD